VVSHRRVPGRGEVSLHLAQEYFGSPSREDPDYEAKFHAFVATLLPDTVLPAGLALEEEREACRALKGSMLRQEVYADDANRLDATPEQIQRARTPYTVTEQNFTIRALQPRGANRHAVFFTHAREAINYHYERNPADPRIQHALTLEVDTYGNVLKQAAIGYGRREQIRVVDAQGNVQLVPDPGLAGLDTADQRKQTTPLLTYTENRVTKAIELADTHRNPLPCEAITFELTGYAPPAPPPGRAIWFAASWLPTSSSPTLVPPAACGTSSPRLKSSTKQPPPAPGVVARSSGCARSIAATTSLACCHSVNCIHSACLANAISLP
jgi:hypothetical protein